MHGLFEDVMLISRAHLCWYSKFFTRCSAFEPLNLSIHQGRDRGQRSQRISPISNIIVNISPDDLPPNLWTFQFTTAVQRTGGSGISQISNFIANISPDVLSSNFWTFQFLKAVQRAGESGISPISNIIANISPDVSPSNTWTFQFTKTVQIIWERCLLLQ